MRPRDGILLWIGLGALAGGYLIGIYHLAGPLASGLVGGIVGGLLGAGAGALARRPWKPLWRWLAAIGLLLFGLGTLWLSGAFLATVLALTRSAEAFYLGR